MQVSEIMSESVCSANVSDPIRKVAQLMRDNDIGALPVYDGDTPAGFITDRDIVIACADESSTLDDQISMAMTPEFIAVSKDRDVLDAAKIMEEKQISRLLVVDGKKAVGIVSLADLANNFDNDEVKGEVLNEIKQ